MPKFMKPLVVKKVSNGTWEVYEELEYHVGSKDSDDVIVVPQGTRTDFASVPRGLWNIFPPDGQYASAAVVHDYLYQEHGDVPKGRGRSRKECDDIFLEAMQVLGVPSWKRYTMWLAVRSFGWKAW